jgi:ELWxxDGT repeat protein
VVLRAEALEDRLLPSFTPTLLLDINPGSAGSFPSSFTQVNNLAFFSAFENLHGQELWVSDGTAAGTRLVKDIPLGANGSYPSDLTNVNGALFFTANEGSGLWESNGTAAGTALLANLNAVSDLTNVNGTLFFSANDGNGAELWETNGAGAGTFRVANINNITGNASPSDLTNVNGTLFFSANDGFYGQEPWESNGTSTSMVADINPAVAKGSYPSDFTNVNGTLFFSANDGTFGVELWESNGTSAGTFMLPDNADNFVFNPTYLANVNGTLFFSADNGNHLAQLYESNGTLNGTFAVRDINDALVSSPINLTNVNGTAFFSAFDSTHGDQLWESNGTTAGTFRLTSDLTSDFGARDPTNVSGTLFFSAHDNTHGYQVWQSDGTTAGTSVVGDITTGYSGYPASLTNVNGALFFSANDGIHGEEPWILPVSTLTGTTISSSPDPSMFGQSVTFTAAVSGLAPGAPNPTGTVDFKEGASDLTPGGMSLTGGQATFITNALVTGSHTITAVYSGDSTFTSSQASDTASPQVVNKDGTSTTVLVGAGSPVSGHAVAFGAIVSNTSGLFGAPTGTVQFVLDGANLGSPVTLVNGAAVSFSRNLLAAGSPHTVTAIYTNADGNFTSGSGSLTQAVAKDATSLLLTSSPNPSVFGQTVSFTALLSALAPGSGTPNGIVDFKEGATDLTPGGVTLSGGQAIFKTSSLPLGQHTLTAIYAGDANFTGSSGNDASAPHVVNKASSRTVMTSFPDPSVFGQVVSFTVAVMALATSHATPTGTVAFSDGATTIGSATLNAVGRATFTTASLSRGNHAINANYGGDAHFLASADDNFGETVQKDATTAAVTASANPAVVSTAITFTLSVQASAPGAGSPTGTVTFLDITTTLGTATLSAAGQATFSTSGLAIGTHAITASYPGDTNFQASVSQILAETIKSSALALVQISALDLSGMPPVSAIPVPQTATSTLTTPAPGAPVLRATWLQSRANAQPPATWDPSRLDHYFAAVTADGAARKLARLPASWLDDPFLSTK